MVIVNVGDSRCVLGYSDGSHIRVTRDHKPLDKREYYRIRQLGGHISELNGTYRVQSSLGVARALGDYDLNPYVTSRPDIFVIQLVLAPPCISSQSCSHTSSNSTSSNLSSHSTGTSVSNSSSSSHGTNTVHDRQNNHSAHSDCAHSDSSVLKSNVSIDSHLSPLTDFLIIACDGIWDVITDEMACELVRACRRVSISAHKAATRLRNLAISLRSTDNISCIVIYLTKPQSYSPKRISPLHSQHM